MSRLALGYGKSEVGVNQRKDAKIIVMPYGNSTLPVT